MHLSRLPGSTRTTKMKKGTLSRFSCWTRGGWDFLLITVSICSHLPNCFFGHKFETRYTSLFFSGTTCYDWKRTPLTNCQDSKGCEWLLRLYIRSDYHERPGYSSKYMGVSSAPSQKDPNRRRPRRGDGWEEWTGNSQPVVITKMFGSKTVGSLLQTCNPSRYTEYIWIYLSYIVLQYVLQPFPPYAAFQCGFRCFPEDQLASSVRWLRCGQIWKWRGTAGIGIIATETNHYLSRKPRFSSRLCVVCHFFDCKACAKIKPFKRFDLFCWIINIHKHTIY